MIHLMLVEPRETVRLNVSLLIQSQFDMKLQAWFSGGGEALKAISGCSPQVILVGRLLPDMDGFEFCKKIAVTYPEIRRVVLSDVVDLQMVNDAMAALVSGLVVCKDARERTLLKAIREVSANGFYWDPNALNV
jgi:DNA-binding NarL/FixJ family response regulator